AGTANQRSAAGPRRAVAPWGLLPPRTAGRPWRSLTFRRPIGVGHVPGDELAVVGSGTRELAERHRPALGLEILAEADRAENAFAFGPRDVRDEVLTVGGSGLDRGGDRQ